jgi:hypothetical protein
MLHGNVLLHGWSVSDVSFYTIDLPLYVIVEALRGLGPDVVHLVAAAFYTLIVVLAVLLARGRAAGAEAAIRMLITAGILLAPQPPQLSNGVGVLLSSPDHVGTAVPVLAAWLLLDRARRRWWMAALAGLLLAWALVGDILVLFTGIGPLFIVGAAGAYRKVLAKGQSLASARWELSLAAVGAAAAVIGWAALGLIRAQGGFTTWRPVTFVVDARTLPARFWSTVVDVLELFGADNYGMHPGFGTGAGLVHLAGFCLAAGAAVIAVRRFWRDVGLVVQLLVVGVALNVAGYIAAVSLLGAREMAAVLPLGAVLAGRLLAGPVIRAKLVPVLGIVLAGYVMPSAMP